jgi:hypothetical protein
MSNSYTTADIIDKVVLKAHIPLANNTFNEDDILSLGNDELQTSLLSQITSVREGYYLTFVDLDINQTGLYPVPSDAIAESITFLQLVNGTSVIPVNRTEFSEQLATNAPSTTTYGFYILGNDILVQPTPSFAGVVRMYYTRRPDVLVQTSDCGQISTIVGTALTVTSVPTSLTVGSIVNIQKAQPNFDTLETDAVITDITGDVITLDAVADTVSVGDFICLEGQTCVPQIPVEFRPLLVQRIVVKMYEIQGYSEKIGVAQKKLDDMEKALFGLISPRVQQSPKVIYPITGGD